jgi:hypothetical protein
MPLRLCPTTASVQLTHDTLETPMHIARQALTAITTIGLLMVGVSAATPASAGTPPPVPFDGPSCGTLHLGEVDGCVTSLQSYLNDLGFGLSVDGQFGANTLAAVKWVQTKAHLTDASVSIDGQVGPVTKSKIRYFDPGYYSFLYAGNATCALVLQTHPNTGNADALISNDGGTGTCTGQLYRSEDGGRSWNAASGSHTLQPGGQLQTYNYSDNSSELEMVCGDANDGGHDAQGCTVAF